MTTAADIAAASRRMRRKHATAALVTLADDDPDAYEALVDAGEIDAALVHATDHALTAR